MILGHIPDESAALDRFFELVDEHHQRKPRVIAKAMAYKEDRVRNFRPDLAQQESTNLPSLVLVSYTDDPGFFVLLDDEESMPPVGGRFFPTLHSFELRFGVTRETLTILAPDIFDRWLAGEDRFKSGRPT